MRDGKNGTLESFWIDENDMSKCENDLMVTKSIKIKNGKILDSYCKEKYEEYKCWREYKGTLWIRLFLKIALECDSLMFDYLWVSATVMVVTI